MALRTASVVLSAALAVGGAFWAGCGDSDGDGGALFYGEVSTITASSTRPSTPRFAWNFLSPSLAWAQSSCSAPGGGNLLFCVNDVCTIVQPDDCSFSQVVTIVEGEPVPAVLSFIDDDDENAEADPGELVSIVPHTLLFCNGDVVHVAGASVNFNLGATTASVTKDRDGCDGNQTPRTPTRTTTPGGTTTPGAGTPTVGTPVATATQTQTYAYSASLNEAPPTSFAFLASLGVVGLLLPVGRRRRVRDRP